MRHVRRRDGTPSAPPQDCPAAAPAPQPRLVRPSATPQARTGPLIVGVQPPGLDNATWDRFRSGRMAGRRTLDLHGCTMQSAFHALAAFLSHAHADRLRVVEVVTGGNSARGAIRRELPVWLNLSELRPLVLAAAYPHAANQGAVRLLLRRTR